MAQTAGDILIDTLVRWDVEVVFGIPGDGINGVMEALRKRKDEIRFVQVRHEEVAAFAACAYAKWTGKLGVCLATSGPGGIHLLNGIYDAKLDSQPVLAITGLQHHDLLDTFTQQDVELDKLFVDSCVYSTRVMGPAHMEAVAEQACRMALGYRQPAHLTIPIDIQSMPVGKAQRSERNVPHHVSELMARSAHLPDREQLQRAADILAEAKKPFILAGRGALGARKELEAIAEKLKAPVGMPLLGKGAIDDRSPYATGGVGLLGTKPSQQAMEECDAILIVGSAFPYVEFYPAPDQAKGVQIDLDPKKIGLRFPVQAGLVGDSRAVLEELLSMLPDREDDSFLASAQEAMKEWRELLEERGTRTDSPMKPQVVTYELNKLLSDDAIVVADSGTNTTWAARYIEMRGDMMFSCSGTLASMACGLGYSIAAAIAFPERQVVAVMGDGGLAMLMGDLVTLRKYGLDVKVVVIKNDELGQIKWEQMIFLGNPEYECELEPIDFATVARGCGLDSVRIEDAGRCAGQLREALERRGPCLIEAVVDSNEPPMPPAVTSRQALHFAESLARGTPNAGKIALTVASDTVRELV